jgi:hypothetical protein
VAADPSSDRVGTHLCRVRRRLCGGRFDLAVECGRSSTDDVGYLGGRRRTGRSGHHPCGAVGKGESQPRCPRGGRGGDVRGD